MVPALLIVDVISDFEFEDGSELYRHVRPTVKHIVKLKKRFLDADRLVLFVNDNYEGRITSVDELIRKTARTDKGRAMLEAFAPQTDRVILKPQRSGFFGTDLEERLRAHDIEKVVVVGWTTDICVLFTAHDAYMRKFQVSVPRDCSAAVKPTHHKDALRFLRRVAEVDVSPASDNSRSATV